MEEGFQESSINLRATIEILSTRSRTNILLRHIVFVMLSQQNSLLVSKHQVRLTIIICHDITVYSGYDKLLLRKKIFATRMGEDNVFVGGDLFRIKTFGIMFHIITDSITEGVHP